MPASLYRHTPLVIAMVLPACSSDSPLEEIGVPSRTIILAVGGELDLKLQTIGPGEYQSPPAISSSAVRFLDVQYVDPPVPAGPTQRFRFQGQSKGQAVITFVHTESNPTISDTVVVK